MSVFIFSVLFGFMAFASAKLGIMIQFAIVVVIGIVLQFIVSNADFNEYNEDVENFLEESIQKVQEERQKRFEDLTKKAEKYDFIGNHQIPVKVNKDTNTYVIEVADLVSAIDKFYEEIEKHYDEK